MTAPSMRPSRRSKPTAWSRASSASCSSHRPGNTDARRRRPTRSTRSKTTMIGLHHAFKAHGYYDIARVEGQSFDDVIVIAPSIGEAVTKLLTHIEKQYEATNVRIVQISRISTHVVP